MHGLPSSRCWLARSALAVGAVVFVLSAGAPARAGSITITPTFASNITNDPNAAAIEGAINSAISDVTSHITSSQNLSVSILFQEMNTGLGGSSTRVTVISYANFRSALSTIAAANPTDTNLQTALASLPHTANNPVNGNPNMIITTAEARNLGFSVSPPAGQPDSTIGLNTSITTPGSPGSSLQYDLQSVATHEIDEALGIGGPGSTLGRAVDPVGDLDLYRYSAPGVRSFTTSSTATSYFSIDGGTTNVVGFNQDPRGDFADWFSVVQGPGFVAQVQDAFATPGAHPRLGNSEITAFEAIGYLPVSQTPPSVPEPTSLTLLGMGGLLLSGYSLLRRKRSTGKEVPA
jgi:hypothetical protein